MNRYQYYIAKIKYKFCGHDHEVISRFYRRGKNRVKLYHMFVYIDQ